MFSNRELIRNPKLVSKDLEKEKEFSQSARNLSEDRSRSLFGVKETATTRRIPRRILLSFDKRSARYSSSSFFYHHHLKLYSFSHLTFGIPLVVYTERKNGFGR